MISCQYNIFGPFDDVGYCVGNANSDFLVEINLDLNVSVVPIRDPTARRKCKIDPWEVLGYSDTAAGGLPTGFAEVSMPLIREICVFCILTLLYMQHTFK